MQFLITLGLLFMIRCAILKFSKLLVCFICDSKMKLCVGNQIISQNSTTVVSQRKWLFVETSNIKVGFFRFYYFNWNWQYANVDVILKGFLSVTCQVTNLICKNEQKLNLNDPHYYNIPIELKAEAWYSNEQIKYHKNMKNKIEQWII